MWRRLLIRHAGWKLASAALAALLWYTANYGLEHGELGPESQRQFQDLPVTILTRPGEQRRFKVTPESVSVAIRGPREQVELLTSEEAVVYVDARGIRDARDVRRPVRVILPPRMRLLWSAPNEVSLETITEADAETQATGGD